MTRAIFNFPINGETFTLFFGKQGIQVLDALRLVLVFMETPLFPSLEAE